MGRVSEVLTGPGAIERSSLDHVVIFPRSAVIEIGSPGAQPLRFSVDVVDARKFHELAAGQYEVLVHYLERNTNQLPRDEAAVAILTRLNEPNTGITAKVSP